MDKKQPSVCEILKDRGRDQLTSCVCSLCHLPYVGHVTCKNAFEDGYAVLCSNCGRLYRSLLGNFPKDDSLISWVNK